MSAMFDDDFEPSGEFYTVEQESRADAVHALSRMLQPAFGAEVRWAVDALLANVDRVAAYIRDGQTKIENER